MKKIIIITLIIAALATGGYFGWKYSFQTKSNSETQTSNSDIEYYHCGMHPWIKSDKPGKCPICGMTLTPVYKSGAKESGMQNMVMVDPAMIQNIGVKTEAVQKRNLIKTIRTTGRVDYNETKQTYITTKFSGYIEKLFVDYTGKQVQQGEPLFEIYSPELVAAQQEYVQAIRYKNSMSASNDAIAMKGANDLLQSAKLKLSLWDISSQQINQLEQTGEIKKSLTFYSPFTGVVIEKNIFDGMQVQAGTNLLKLADISEVWIYADVYESQLPFVKVRDQATVDLPYNGDKTLKGKVSFIYPYLQDQTRTAKVRIDFPNVNQALKKDMYVTVNIKPTISINALAVPEQAVIHSGSRDLVVLKMGEGKFMSMDVKLGVLAGGYYEIKEGVNEGDTIVTSSQFLIDSESNLKAGTSAMGNMPGMNMGEIKEEMTSMKGMEMQKTDSIKK